MDQNNGVDQMKITIIGAGKTGRGFLARLLTGQDITFIDKDASLVTHLNEAKTVRVSYFGNKKPACQVSFSKALTWEQVESMEADLILVSVGGSNLADVGRELSRFVKPGQRILVAENASKPAQKLYDAIGVPGVRISESTVFCTTIEGENMDIRSEWYPYLQYDAEPMADVLPDVDTLKPIFGFGDFLTRKLFTYNSASCIIAYLGYQKGYKVYSDAANDPEILSLLDRNYAIINECMCREFGYDRADQKEFALLSRDKFTDRTIADTVSRNGREPQRKIGKTERVTGPLLLQEKYGMDTSVLEMTLAAMLLYHPAEEEAWNQMVQEQGYQGILRNLAGLDADGEMAQRILAMAESGKIFG